MSESSSIFDASAAPAANNSGAATPQPQSHDELGTILAGIKNERGEQKYKSVADALVALQHSQSYIPQLKNELEARTAELEQLSGKLTKVDELERVVQKLTQPTKQATETPNAPVVDDAVIADVVMKKLSQVEQERQAKANQEAVANAIINKFGADKANEVFYSKATDLGFSKDQINTLAASNPKAVLQLLGVSGEDVPKQSTTPPSGTVRSDSFQGSPTTFIGRESQGLHIGATTKDFQRLMENSKSMVEELHQRGMSVNDLTDPRTFFSVMK